MLLSRALHFVMRLLSLDCHAYAYIYSLPPCSPVPQPKLVLPASFLASHPQAAAVEMLSSKGAKLPLAPGADGTDGASGASGTSSVSGAGGSVVVQGGSAGVMRFLADLYPQQLGHLYPPADTALGQQVGCE